MATVVAESATGYGYTYAPEEEVLANVTAGMNKYGVSLIPRITTFSVTPISYTKRKFTKDGIALDELINEMLVSGEIEYTWVDDENPEDMVVVPWALVGKQNDPSMAFGSAMTYCGRYFMLKYFQSATTKQDDVDAYVTKQKEKEEAEERETAKAIVDAIHAMVSAFVGKYADHRENVLSIIKKHVIIDGKSSADYYKITKPDVAVGLKEAITKYIEENTPKVGVSNQNGEVKDGVSE
jgi:hypothetical protein